MDKQDLKEAAKNAGKLWVAKKGFQWTTSILKVGIVIGAGYFGYKYFRENEDEIRKRLSL
jgi:uncharacterized membrane protein YebE (DUF533 family)